MAKKVVKLDFIDIVMGADAELIKQAYEARLKIDGYLKEREEAYRRIAELEEQVEEVIGEPGVFQFPAPEMPVAQFPKPKPAPKPAPVVEAPEEEVPAEEPPEVEEVAEKVEKKDADKDGKKSGGKKS